MPQDGDPKPTSRRGLTTAEAAARLGVKRQTVYAYVSRGVLSRTVAEDGRTSLFDAAEIERLRRGGRADTDGELTTFIATGLTRVDDEGLWIRGQDLVRAVSNDSSFTTIVDLLWDSPTGERWPEFATAPGACGSDTASSAPDGGRDVTGAAERREALDRAVALVATDGTLLDALRIVTAGFSALDPLRHDLSPKGVRAAGRSLITALSLGLPPKYDGPDNSLVEGLWRRLSPVPADAAKLQALDAAMALLTDHGLAGSTFAARVAASVRADPYSVVSAGLGVLGGTMHGAASASVHELLVEAEVRGDATAAVGAVRRRLGNFPGFGHQVYTQQDPRYGALMARLMTAWGDDPRLVNVYRVRDIVAERSDAIPNVDLALGSLTYLAGMPFDGGEVIFAIARTAGWLAHAIEEYDELPLRFRPRAKYIGPRPTSRRAAG